MKHDQIPGSFYEYELQKVKNNKMYQIEENIEYSNSQW